MARLDTLAQAALIKSILAIRDECDRVLDVLLPDDEALDVCTHPADQIEDHSSMGEEEYRCARCGAVSPTPFHTS